jgi:hypothetical protein
MRIASWIPKDKNTYSEYVILIAVSRQKWICERASMLSLYVNCLSCYGLPAFSVPKRFRNRICFHLQVKRWRVTQRAVSIRNIACKWLNKAVFVWLRSVVDSPPFHLADRKITSLQNTADALPFTVKFFWEMEAGCRKLLQTFVKKILRDLTKCEKESDCRKKQISH